MYVDYYVLGVGVALVSSVIVLNFVFGVGVDIGVGVGVGIGYLCQYFKGCWYYF